MTLRIVGKKWRVMLRLMLVMITCATVGVAERVAAQDTTTSVPVTDGPYVMLHGDSVATVYGVCAGQTRTIVAVPKDGQIRFANPCMSSEQYVVDVHPVIDTPYVFTGVQKIFAISDFEGEFDTVVPFLKKIGIVDDSLKWAWGTGHFVLAGDLIDRGAKATEALWLFQRLEREARAVGGRVHYVLGNHDVMLLNGDHRYVHAKYRDAEKVLALPLDTLFNTNSALGRWIRAKPVMVQFDSLLFVHGGVSPQLAKRRLSVDSVNALIRVGLNDRAKIKQDSTLRFVFGPEGPLWYRGYFKERALSNADIANITSVYGVKTIVVGHTIVPNITAMHNRRVIAIDINTHESDSARKLEGLLIEDGKWYRVDAVGMRADL